MGYFGNLKLKQKAQNLRKEGYSYNKIIALLHIPKSTVSDWCKDVSLNKEQISQLYKSKKQGAIKGSYIASQNKIKQRLEITQKLFLIGKKVIGALSKRDRFIAGVAFYSSEGTKTDKGCAIANSDPYIINVWFLGSRNSIM